MSNDATDRPVRLGDERDFAFPWQEPLALKSIYDELNEAELPAAFCRNVLLYYFALTQLVAMRGNGCKLRKADLERWAFINPHSHAECRKFLEELRLIRVEERMEGGNRKTLFLYLLRAPLAGCQNGTRGEPATEGPFAAAEDPAGCQNSTHRSSEVRTSTEVLRTSGADGAVTAEPRDETAAVVDRQQPPAASRGRVSLRGWTRTRIQRHHNTSPSSPPEGTTPVQAVMCAMATTRGSQEVFPTDASYAKAAPRLAAALARPYRKEFVLTYTDWMDAALLFHEVPRPKNGSAPTLEYWLASMVAASIRDSISSYEQAHDDAKHDHSGELSDREIANIFAEAKGGKDND